MKIVGKTVIHGCESRGDALSPYLTRYAFPRVGWFRPALHVFHRSDADEHHDHPWPFVSIILWRGYIEETPALFADLRSREVCVRDGRCVRLSRKWPGMVLFRSATHRHRVELVDGKPAVTLVIFGKRRREWGFFTAKGWQHWKAYFAERGCE